MKSLFPFLSKPTPIANRYHCVSIYYSYKKLPIKPFTKYKIQVVIESDEPSNIGKRLRVAFRFFNRKGHERHVPMQQGMRWNNDQGSYADIEIRSLKQEQTFEYTTGKKDRFIEIHIFDDNGETSNCYISPESHILPVH